MDAPAAVEIAKNSVLKLFGEDGLANVRLEEIERQGEVWHVTIGFNRPLVEAVLAEAVLGRDAGATLAPRSYRVVTLRDSDGEIQSIKMKGLF
ncbi:hypothetical protein IHQ68_14650 [Chelatococcus sambhunathii]|uniref:Uncharacterized protein n=1 Tax=Chelatococcus sambhunathii TaxID=363953 RepID=A0ABU1DIC2_9HYPH|nr:hypothetical protein [Chelatococcus sambhunathii]MDR4307861.1 hypothetical protein [Chelatococcus sambhunathii]